ALSRYMRRLPKADSAALLPRQAALLARVFPVLQRVEAVADAPHLAHAVPDPQELRRRLVQAVRQLFMRLTDRHPVIIVIDDLQWADADSLALLDELIRPPDPPTVLLVATVRTTTTSDSHASDTALLLSGMETLSLGRMPPGEARELAQVLLR